jgi:hypothetical protein
MKKPTIEEAEVSEPRRLNMEEKRKVERLLIADIDSATYRYDEDTKEERRALVERLGRSVREAPPQGEAERGAEVPRQFWGFNIVSLSARPAALISRSARLNFPQEGRIGEGVDHPMSAWAQLPPEKDAASVVGS